MQYSWYSAFKFFVCSKIYTIKWQEKMAKNNSSSVCALVITFYRFSHQAVDSFLPCESELATQLDLASGTLANMTYAQA